MFFVNISHPETPVNTGNSPIYTFYFCYTICPFVKNAHTKTECRGTLFSYNLLCFFLIEKTADDFFCQCDSRHKLFAVDDDIHNHTGYAYTQFRHKVVVQDAGGKNQHKHNKAHKCCTFIAYN